MEKTAEATTMTNFFRSTLKQNIFIFRCGFFLIYKLNTNDEEDDDDDVTTTSGAFFKTKQTFSPLLFFESQAKNISDQSPTVRAQPMSTETLG